MALTDSDKMLLTVIIGIIFVVVLYVEFKYLRNRKVGKSIAEGKYKKDQAYNTLLTTKAIRNKLKLERYDTVKADYMIQKAETALEENDFASCMSTCSKVRDELMRCKRDGIVIPVVEASSAEMERINAEKSAVKQRLSQTSEGKDSQYLQAKFELNAAKGDLGKYEGDGETRRKASELVSQASQLFDSKQYQKSLSSSFRARKLLSGEAAEEQKPPTERIALATPAVEPQAEEPDAEPAKSCAKCGEPFEEDDAFCGSCGSSLKERKCAKCGAELRERDTFCRKCGTKSS